MTKSGNIDAKVTINPQVIALKIFHTDLSAAERNMSKVIGEFFIR